MGLVQHKAAVGALHFRVSGPFDLLEVHSFLEAGVHSSPSSALAESQPSTERNGVLSQLALEVRKITLDDKPHL